MTTIETITGLQIRVQTPDTSPEQLVVDSDRVLIGSGAHCEVRLPNAEAQAEHVLITFRGGAVFATARALHPPPMLNGRPFTEAPLKPDSVLSIGRSEITISIVELAENAKLPEKAKEKTSPLTYLLAAVAVPLCLFVILDEGKPELSAGMPNEAPALWEGGPATCPQKAAAAAMSVAREKKVLAEGKRERGPFDVVDAVAAVPLFDAAADCFKIGGDAARSAEMAASGARLKRQLEEEYRAHQMRLLHALDIKDIRVVQKEVKTLLAMLKGQSHPYVAWLSNLDRQLKLSAAKANKKK